MLKAVILKRIYVTTNKTHLIRSTGDGTMAAQDLQAQALLQIILSDPIQVSRALYVV